jgi:hypothetical protein
MVQKMNLLNVFIAGGTALASFGVNAQTGQFMDCSNGGAGCDMLYASDDVFLTSDCVDCVSGEIQVEPAVTKTSYETLAYSMPADTRVEVMPSGGVRTTTTQVSGVRMGNKDVQTTRKVERIEEQGLYGKWVTHDTNEKIAFGEGVHDWDAARGETLKSLLTQWSEVSGWTVVWKLDRDYNLEAGVVFRGTFTEVASAIIRTFARAKPAPIGTFYRGNRVLVVNIQEDENAH